MAIFVDLLLIVVIFATLLFAAYFPRIPEALKNAVNTLLGRQSCEHESFRRQKDHM